MTAWIAQLPDGYEGYAWARVYYTKYPDATCLVRVHAGRNTVDVIEQFDGGEVYSNLAGRVIPAAAVVAWCPTAPPGPSPAAQLQQRLDDWLVGRDLVDGVRYYAREAWRARGEPYGNDAELTLTLDGATLYGVVNHTATNAAWAFREDDALHKYLEELGYYYELGYAWSLHLYRVKKK
jgi:hypothetical protein